MKITITDDSGNVLNIIQHTADDEETEMFGDKAISKAPVKAAKELSYLASEAIMAECQAMHLRGNK